MSDQIMYPDGRILEDGNFSFLEGRLLTIIETIGLNPNQEKAVKDLIKQEIWNAFNSGQYISSEQFTNVIVQNASLEAVSIK